MSSNIQLSRLLRDVPYFLGVFPANKLPNPKDVPKGSALIANYSNAGTSGTHWIAILHMNDPDDAPMYFDSYGFSPGDLNAILKEHATFEKYMERLSEHAGYGAKNYHTSRVELQCSDSDYCGQYCVLAVKFNALPTDPTGKPNPKWKPFIHWASSCEASDKAVREAVPLPAQTHPGSDIANKRNLHSHLR